MKEKRSDSSLQSYRRELEQYPLLTAEEERELSMKIKNGNKAAKDQFVCCNLRLVFNIVVNYAKKLHIYDETKIMDLIQLGNLGLLTAVSKYDGSKGFRFSTYATWWIHQSLGRNTNAVLENISIPSHLQTAYAKYKRYIGQYLQQHDDFPSNEILLNVLGCSERMLQELHHLNEKVNLVSLNQTIGEDEDVTLEDFQASLEDDYAKVEEEIDRNILLYFLKQNLSNRDYYILYYRFLAPRKKTFETLSNELSITRQRVGQLEEKAKQHLRSFYSDDKKLKKRYILDSSVISSLSQMNLLPKSLKEQAQMLYLRNHLSEFDYFVTYYAFFEPDIKSLYRKFKKRFLLSQEQVDQIIKEVSIHNQKILNTPEYREFLMQEVSRTPSKILDIKLAPNQQDLIFSLLPNDVYIKMSSFFDRVTYQELEEHFSEYLSLLTPLEQEHIRRYLDRNDQIVTEEEMVATEQEINLLLLGYGKEGLPMERMKSYYLEHRNAFSFLQQAIIEQNLLHIPISHEKKEQLSRIKFPSAYRLTARLKLEMMYYGIDHFFQLQFPASKALAVLENYHYLFTDEETAWLVRYYHGTSMKQLAQENNVLYEPFHDRISNLKNRLLRIHLGLDLTSLPKNPKIWEPFLLNMQYELLESTRDILKRHILERESYESLAKRYQTTVTSISNIITDGLRKLEMMQYGISPVLLFSKQEWENLCQKTNFSEKEKKAITLRYFDGKDIDEIRTLLDFKDREINILYRSFKTQLITMRCKGKKVTKEDALLELNAHETDTVLNEEERMLLAFCLQHAKDPNLKSKAMEAFHFTEYQYRHIGRNIRIKIAQRTMGYLVPPFGHIAREELQTILEDKRVPISKDERFILEHLKEINQASKMSIENIALALHINVPSVRRRYLRAILSIKKYLDHKIEPQYDYETDIKQYLKYFSEYDCKIIEALYKNMIQRQNLHHQFHVTRDQMLQHINRIEKRLIAMLKNEPFVRKFDFEYARTVLKDPALPIFQNKEQLIQIYEMYVGENGYKPHSIPEIIKELHLSYDTTTVLNGVYITMLAILKHREGEKLLYPFTGTMLQQFYQEKKETLSRKEQYHLEKMMRKLTTTFSTISGRKWDLPSSLYYKVFSHFYEVPFQFEQLTKQTTFALLQQYPELKGSTKKVLKCHTGIPEKEFMSKKEQMQTMKLLVPLYLKIQETKEKIGEPYELSRH